MTEIVDARPTPSRRVISDRREPAVIAIRTCFHYHPPRDGDEAESTARVARYGSEVTDFGEFSSQPAGYRHVGDVFQRMVSVFGDDADLEIVVRRKKAKRHQSNPTQATPAARERN